MRPEHGLCSCSRAQYSTGTHRLEHGVALHDVVEEGEQGHGALVVPAEAQEHGGREVGLCAHAEHLLAGCPRLHTNLDIQCVALGQAGKESGEDELWELYLAEFIIVEAVLRCLVGKANVLPQDEPDFLQLCIV